MNEERQIDYQALQAAFRQESINISPAECHGLLCGLYCGGLSQDKESWKKPLLEHLTDAGALSAETMHLLGEMQKQLVEQLATFLGLTPMIPDDDVSLGDRLEALIAWCEGWLLGFGSQNGSVALSEDTKEAVKAIQQIADVDPDVGNADESWEKAFWEVVEYARVAVETVFTEHVQKSDQQPQSGSVH
ncbi:MAG: hypothetical protein D6694_12570 [Gammaproteobacteria bacterium]|nr:MAG: hypothetical protein D6694_12570 [Gammaproteobacteria bacterium]